MTPVLEFVAEMLMNNSPIMSTGAAFTALIDVAIGSTVVLSTARWCSSCMGTTVTWAPVSATAFLPWARPNFPHRLKLGGAKARDP